MQWYMILCYQRALEHHQCALHVLHSRIDSSAFRLFHFPARLGQSVCKSTSEDDEFELMVDGAKNLKLLVFMKSCFGAPVWI